MNAPQPIDRLAWQRAIEQDLGRFRPDAVEGAELLDALMAGVQDRYDVGQLADVVEQYMVLRSALIELDRTVTGYPEDAATILKRTA